MPVTGLLDNSKKAADINDKFTIGTVFGINETSVSEVKENMFRNYCEISDLAMLCCAKAINAQEPIRIVCL